MPFLDTPTDHPLPIPRTTPDHVLADVRATPGAHHRPSLGAILRRVAQSLLVACAMPATLFYVCFRVGDIWMAIGAALAWQYGALGWRALAKRRTSGLLILTTAVMTGRTVLALATESTFLYFLQPIITDGLIATAFLLSLASSRPMVARLAGDFYPMDHELSLRPRIQRLLWRLTLMWGAVSLGKALFVLWLLQSQSLGTFVLVKSLTVLAVNALAIAATIGAAVAVGRREGLIGSAVARLAPAGH